MFFFLIVMHPIGKEDNKEVPELRAIKSRADGSWAS
jgi:hypothetical protein